MYLHSALDSTKLLLGRPNGGVLIIYPDTFGANTMFIPTTSLYSMSNIILHIFCVYMPFDINNDSNIDGYHSILSEISTLCMKQKAEHNIYRRRYKHRLNTTKLLTY